MAKQQNTEALKKKSPTVGKQKKKSTDPKPQKLGDKTQIDDETTI